MFDVLSKAVNLLLGMNINSYPVDPDKIIDSHNNWVWRKYSEAKDILEKIGKLDYCEGRNSFVIKFENQYLILIRDDLTSRETYNRKFHEIAHIILNHSTTNGIVGLSTDKTINEKQENEADYFVLCFTANFYVLLKLGITEPNVIAKTSYLSHELSIKVAGEIQNIKKIEPTKSEEKLVENFKAFSMKNDSHIRKKLIFILTFMVILLSLVLFFYLNNESGNTDLADTFSNQNNAKLTYDEKDSTVTDIYGNDLEAEAEYVYILPNSNEYHYEKCEIALNNFTKVSCIPRSTAYELNYTLCDVCALDRINNLKKEYNLNTKYDYSKTIYIDKFGNKLTDGKE